MRVHRPALGLSLVAALCASVAAQDESPQATREPASANPMASFARMVPGEWRTTAARGTSTFDTWHWGPGQLSMRVMTDGSSSGIEPEPWRELQVFYWHPARKQVRLLGLSPYARGVAEGTIEFEGDSAEGVFDLHQTGGLRKLGLRWEFDGPDTYRDTLLEATGPEGLQPMNEWTHFRSKGDPAPRTPTVEVAPQPSKLQALERLLGHTWEAKGTWAGAEAFDIRTTLEWIPYADGIYARTVALNGEAEPAHLLDTYVFHHTGTDELRCLALSSGGVHEGSVTVLDGGALQFDLKSHEGDGVTSHVVRFDFQPDGTLHNRVWSVEGAERTLRLDVHQEPIAR